MSAVPQATTTLAEPSSVVRAPATTGRPTAPVPVHTLSVRLSREWLPRALWTITRTGRPGLVGIALLLGAVIFLLSTHLPVTSEVEALRAGLTARQGRARDAEPDQSTTAAAATLELPDRTGMPAILSQLFTEAGQAGLAIDTAKYENSVMKSSGVIRNQIAFPVIGAYPQIREFIDRTLATMPYVALSDLVLTRASIAHGNVEAQIRLTVYTRSAP